MGTHPTSPSHVQISSSSQTLASYLKEHPELIGSAVRDRFPSAAEGNLPFLFKVLSVEKALSIQTHPDKATAEKLHKELPNIYKGNFDLLLLEPNLIEATDDNHKPELALALTPFQAMCGFLPLPDIAKNLKETPELSSLIPRTILDDFLSVSSSESAEEKLQKVALKNVFAAIMTADEADYKPQLDTLVSRYEGLTKKDSIAELVLRLNSQFPGDIGIFCAFLLNHVVLRPGEAIFLGAGEPHAYVSGGKSTSITPESTAQ